MVTNSSSSFSDPQRVTIHAWANETSAATEALGRVSLSSPPVVAPGVRGTSAPLDIPLDELSSKRAGDAPHTAKPAPQASPPNPSREPVRRDSLKRREALLKGKEGTRRRQRWENDRLLSNPWAQPPSPSDWMPTPTHRRTVVPYFLAPLWDIEIAARKAAEDERKRVEARRRRQMRSKPKSAAPAAGSVVGTEAVREGKDKDLKDEGLKDERYGLVPKELKRTLKKAKGARTLLQELEEEIRRFVTSWERKRLRMEQRKAAAEKQAREELDTSDEEIVFVGRGGAMRDVPPSPITRRRASGDVEEVVYGLEDMRIEEGEKEKLVFGAEVGDAGAGFGRWLVHSIAAYYGLRTWSVTRGQPARREAYVGIKGAGVGVGEGGLPRPLYVMV